MTLTMSKELTLKLKVVNGHTHYPTLENDVLVARPSIFGNPYTHMKLENTVAEFQCKTREEAIDNYRTHFYKKIHSDKKFKKEINKILKKMWNEEKINLVCYCQPKLCHGDVVKSFLERLYRLGIRQLV